MGATNPSTDAPLYLGAGAIARLLEPRAARDALAKAYADLAADPGCAAKSLAFALTDGSIHVKASLAPLAHDCLVAKVNVNLPGNPARGLPTIRGLLVLMDATRGTPLAVLDSAEITARRTAATAALAATHGARGGARVAALVGCGKQADYLVDAMIDALPGLADWRLFDLDVARSAALAAALGSRGLVARAESELVAALRGADVVIACTTATRPYLLPTHLRPGCFVAAVGADNPGKSEVAPACFAGARILVDDLDAALGGGDLAHAVRAETASRESVHATLADLASGRRRGREGADDIVIFDSTGSGLQDLAVALAAWRAAVECGEGLRLSD